MGFSDSNIQKTIVGKVTHFSCTLTTPFMLCKPIDLKFLSMTSLHLQSKDTTPWSFVKTSLCPQQENPITLRQHPCYHTMSGLYGQFEHSYLHILAPWLHCQHYLQPSPFSFFWVAFSDSFIDLAAVPGYLYHMSDVSYFYESFPSQPITRLTSG